MKIVNDGKPKKIITLSFDDSVTQDVRFISILKKYGIPCTFNLNSGLFGHKGEIGPPEKRVPHCGNPADKVKEIYEGYEVAAHTLTHPALDTLTKEEIINEVDGDRIQIEKLTGQKVVGFAFPGMNRFNEFVIDTIKENTPLIYARTAEFTYDFAMPKASGLHRWAPTCFFLSEKMPGLLEEFEKAKPDEDILFYLVGHTYEFDIEENWEQTEAYLAKMASIKDVVLATNAEVAEYVRGKENV